MELGQSQEKYQDMISQTIESSLIDLYGINGYKSIIQTMMKECNKSEKEITGNYELFSSIIQRIFGKIGDSKILEPIKMEINKNQNTSSISQP
ncbi:hypothetical protein [Nitrosarchaeum sp.]|uniref:hypothetical protein n=1 Tax=Nitrosarchaeum sp. TaxID=2026886 RepID=UPI00247CCF8D|nr:hypothetical protein [Nitrosarchaeum sp.]MCV0411590.1 hypothetical protein [Nitrosarchaeum sp.]